MLLWKIVLSLFSCRFVGCRSLGYDRKVSEAELRLSNAMKKMIN